MPVIFAMKIGSMNSVLARDGLGDKNDGKDDVEGVNTKVSRAKRREYVKKENEWSEKFRGHLMVMVRVGAVVVLFVRVYRNW